MNAISAAWETRGSTVRSSGMVFSLIKRRLDPRPVIERFFLAGDDRDDDLAPAGAAQGFDALGQLLFGRGEGGAADQLGRNELPFLRLHKDEMAAVVEEISRVSRLEMPRQFEIAVHLV